MDLTRRQREQRKKEIRSKVVLIMIFMTMINHDNYHDLKVNTLNPFQNQDIDNFHDNNNGNEDEGEDEDKS